MVGRGARSVRSPPRHEPDARWVHPRGSRSTLRHGDRTRDWSEGHRGRVNYDLGGQLRRRCRPPWTRRRPWTRAAPRGSAHPGRRVRRRDPVRVPRQARRRRHRDRRGEGKHRYRDGSRGEGPRHVAARHLPRHHRRGGRGGWRQV